MHIYSKNLPYEIVVYQYILYIGLDKILEMKLFGQHIAKDKLIKAIEVSIF